MKITKARAIPIELELNEPFTIANETIETAHNVFICIETDEGIVGWGCATPDTVTSETVDTVLSNFEKTKNLILNCDPTCINRLNFIMENNFTGNPSLKAGINMAAYDILGKKAEMPLYRILGGFRQKIETSVTIGINSTEFMTQKAKEIVKAGFKSLKIKCGIKLDDDVKNILAIKESVGSNVKLRLDANEGYSVEDALRVIEILDEKGVDIEILEQPTKASFLYSLKDVKTKCPVPIMADETALSLTDNVKLVKLEIADIINIKLMKIGGITNAMKANTIAEVADVPIMVGCMNESMAAMAAGVHFACAFKNIQYADLDSVLDFKKDVVKGGARYEEGYVIPSEDPGLGIEVQL
ncbi:MAG: dipeptide epimerase [Crenarchaeota archaeon]|nr:dipeptide epimerase [Thermoproteota archaeon]